MAHQGATKEFHPEYRIKGESREEKRKSEMVMLHYSCHTGLARPYSFPKEGI